MNTTTTLTTQLCPKSFKKAISSLNRRAVRLGLPEITFECLGSRSESQVRNVEMIAGFGGRCSRSEVEVTVYDFAVSHLDVKQAGWSLLGRISADSDGATFFEAFSTDVDPEQWEDRNPRECDHCETRRKRNFGWAVENAESGEALLVGSSCLRELIGGHSASALEFAAEVSIFLKGFGGDEPQRSHRDVFCPVDFALACVESEVGANGWTENARDCYGNLIVAGSHRVVAAKIREFGGKAYSPTSSEVREAQRIQDALLEIDAEDDFLKDLQFCLRKQSIPTRRLGLLCYARRALERHERKLAEERLNAQRKHFGEVKKRYELTLTGVRCSSFDSFHGLVHINIFEDADKNLFVWKTGTFSCSPGETYRVKGTVKGHSEYKGAAQTELTRCALLEGKAAA